MRRVPGCFFSRRVIHLHLRKLTWNPVKLYRNNTSSMIWIYCQSATRCGTNRLEAFKGSGCGWPGSWNESPANLVHLCNSFSCSPSLNKRRSGTVMKAHLIYVPLRYYPEFIVSGVGTKRLPYLWNFQNGFPMWFLGVPKGCKPWPWMFISESYLNRNFKTRFSQRSNHWHLVKC